MGSIEVYGPDVVNDQVQPAWFTPPRLELRCRCSSFPDQSCVSPATQEDGRCDICRAGCTRITLTEHQTGKARHHAHVRTPRWAMED